MIREDRLQEIYTTVFTAMIRHDILSLPVSMHGACRNLGIDLVPLSKICVGTGLNAEQVFGIWGNEDGVVQVFNGCVRISYNDFAPAERTRFTICEEISHYLLGHVWDARFNLFTQDYDRDVYRTYEEEARTAAGLLLCQPQFFYQNKDCLNPRMIAFLCDVTSACAQTRCSVLEKYRASIQRNPIYAELPQPDVYKPFWRAQRHINFSPRPSAPSQRRRGYCPSAIIVDA